MNAYIHPPFTHLRLARWCCWYIQYLYIGHMPGNSLFHACDTYTLRLNTQLRNCTVSSSASSQEQRVSLLWLEWHDERLAVSSPILPLESSQQAPATAWLVRKPSNYWYIAALDVGGKFCGSTWRPRVHTFSWYFLWRKLSSNSPCFPPYNATSAFSPALTISDR